MKKAVKYSICIMLFIAGFLIAGIIVISKDGLNHYSTTDRFLYLIGIALMFAPYYIFNTKKNIS